jgi:sugar-specific transcriptional regulator TrmB
MDYNFFKELGISRLETDILLSLYRLGSQPASIIARHLGIERTKTYRHLLLLTKSGLVKKTQKNGITTFFVRDTQDLTKKIEKKVEHLGYLERNKKKIINEIQALQQEKANIPKITIYDNSDGVGTIFDDIYRTIRSA